MPHQHEICMLAALDMVVPPWVSACVIHSASRLEFSCRVGRASYGCIGCMGSLSCRISLGRLADDGERDGVCSISWNLFRDVLAATVCRHDLIGRVEDSCAA